MPSRQENLLDAAITLLGSLGSRQLTHRAVDAAAGLPAGSTSNYFKTRDALLGAIVERFAERERASWEALATFVRPATQDELVTALAGFVRRATGPDKVMTLARYSLFVEAALRPDLRATLAGTVQELRAWAAHLLKTLGSSDPERDCRLIFDQLDGIMLHQLSFPDPAFNPDIDIATLVHAGVASAGYGRKGKG